MSVTHQKIKHQTTEHIYCYAAHLMLQDNMSVHQVSHNLKSEGLPATHAETVSSHVATTLETAKSKQIKRDLFFGGLWFTAGVCIWAGNAGLIALAPIVLGTIQLLRSMPLLSRFSKS
ncbi:hypothetical protein [Fulvivirga ligni]|uniref:hypothetical protein n=1 Tax=Fulvivirga ligni TaxID=2904246 RepID=UPI001F212320|nr:hypothetical protein [Fulvivirga ligni]UII20618.1 hypothetical protein LVD16_22510 [Fulvivirga ligni]